MNKLGLKNLDYSITVSISMSGSQGISMSYFLWFALTISTLVNYPLNTEIITCINQ